VLDYTKKLEKSQVDFHKAFDYVEYEYLGVVVIKMRYPVKWRK
jgi:hypothetical protein